MKLKRFLKIIGISCLVIFVSLFTWANWTPLSPGEKAPPVNFKQYSFNSLKDSSNFIQLSKEIRKMDGVVATSINLKSKILSVGYAIDALTCGEIEQKAKSAFGISLQAMQADPSKPKCPMTATLNAFSEIRKALNIRQ